MFQYIFCKELKENIKDKFIRDDYRIKDINNLIKVTINFDNKLYERKIEKNL